MPDRSVTINEEVATERNVVIKAEGLRKAFGELHVLKGIDLEVRQSEVVCIIGPSGSGKSTLLRCIAFLEEYSGGRVYIEGKLLGYKVVQGTLVRESERHIDKVRRNVGMVFQQFNLWPHMTVLRNVTEALRVVKKMDRREAEMIALETLRKVGMEDKMHNYPAQLSGGQQQRAAIARALAMKPHVMLIDEPTSALDPELVGEVLQVIQDLVSEGMTMTIVSHEMGFAANVADRVVFLDEGRIIEQGGPAQIFKNPESKRLKQFLDTWKSREL